MIASRQIATFLAMLFFTSLRPSPQFGGVLSEWYKPMITSMTNFYPTNSREDDVWNGKKKQRWVIPSQFYTKQVCE